MKTYVQFDENGRQPVVVNSDGEPNHPRQYVDLDLSLLQGRRMDLKTGELVDDSEYIAQQQKQAAIQNHIYDLAAEKLEETAAKPSNWEDLTVQEKAEISLGQK